MWSRWTVRRKKIRLITALFKDKSLLSDYEDNDEVEAQQDNHASETTATSNGLENQDFYQDNIACSHSNVMETRELNMNDMENETTLARD
ncbi:unnamed protein product, partial [Didymodactylos carnosus]